ncbi:MAG: MFS transporter [Burkholderiaceae bacterium]
MSPRLVVFMLALLLGLQPITTDLYLPALPALTGDLAGSLIQAQLTLTALLLAFGCSQLVWGPLSDRYGRRPVLLWGLALYVLAALACAAAPTFTWLIAARAVQGVGMGAAVVCARAIVRDLYAPHEGARVMSQGLSGLGVLICVSAVLGTAVATGLGWRAALTAVALFGAGTLALVALRFAETRPVPGNASAPAALPLATLAQTWLTILRHPTFQAFSALACATYAALFMFLAASSFVFIQTLGWSLPAYGAAMLAVSLAYLGGTFLCRYWLARHGLQRTAARAGGVSLLAGTLLVALYLAGAFSGPWGGVLLLLPVCLCLVGHGIHQPCSQTGAVGPFPQAAGAAAALNGFFMMCTAFGVGSWLGFRLQGQLWPLVAGMAFWCACIAAVCWTLVWRLKLPAPAFSPPSPPSLPTRNLAGAPPSGM